MPYFGYAYSMRIRVRGFTLAEVLIVVAVLGILTALVMSTISSARERAYFSRANTEFATMANAVRLWVIKYNYYPSDVSRGLPAGIEEFIAKNDTSSIWPEAPWPDSVYDYDQWLDLDGVETYQISIRFCPKGGPYSACKFPDQPWAKDFNINSALYYCIKGNCRAHSYESPNYPGYCVNCPGNKAIGS